MNPHSMSPELTELENRLKNRAGPEPTADSRDRVLGAVAVELARPAQAPSVPQWDSGWWAAVAAGVLIVLNLSMASASENEFSLRPASNAGQQITVEFQALRQLEAQQEGIFK